MRLTFRRKLMTIVGIAALAFVISIIAQAAFIGRMGQQLLSIRQHFIPIIELSPRLSTDFEHLRRSFQDSVAAQDREALEKTSALRDKLLDDVSAAGTVVEAAQVSELRTGIQNYFESATAVSKSLMAGETGLTLVSAMSEMQAKQASVERTLKQALTFDRGKLEEAFSVIERSQKASSQMLILISVACLIAVLLLSIVISRSVLRSLGDLSSGIRRFGQGDFSSPISVKSHDELGDLAAEANQMATRTQGLMRELESFSYSVAHDLRAPLRSILGFSNIMIEDHGHAMPAEAKESVSRVISSAKRMGLLIDGLLSLSRLARAEIKKDRVNLSAVAQDIIAELRVNHPDRKVTIKIAEELNVQGDPALLRIVLTNLLSNAWKFTSKTPAALIELGMEASQGDRVYFVRDNGAGFDMQYASKLFGTFQRLHSNEDFEGTGIGLATVRTIVGRHGGEIWAEGAIGRGAIFRFNLWKRATLSENKPRVSTRDVRLSKTDEGGIADVERSNIAGRG